MKKIIASLILTVAFASFGSIAFADTTACGQVDPITNQVVTCGNGSPENVTNVWGTTNSQIAHVAPGATVYDEAGIPSLCPTWFSNYCVDISHTEYYRNGMRAVAHQIQAGGFSLGIFTYWATH